MRHALIGTILTLLMMPTKTQMTHMQALTDQEVQRAIDLGTARKALDFAVGCHPSAGFGESFGAGMTGGIQYVGGYTGYLHTQFGRIAFIAQEAKRLYKPFALADVTKDMREPSVIATINPDQPSASGNIYRVSAMIESLVIKSRSKPEVILQPLETQLEPVEFGNLMGGKVTSNRAVARFAIDDFNKLPTGDADLVTVTTAGERKCKLSSDNRQKLFKK